MAEADDRASISLREAKALLVRSFGSALAEELLVEELANGRMPWAYVMARGDASPANTREFWRFGPKVNFEEGWARTMYIPGPSYHGITVSHTHVLALLPRRQGEHEKAATSHASKVWIVDEAKRMKVAGEVPDGISKTDFAKLIHHRMVEARRTDPAVRPVGWRHIVNSLSTWGLWPLSSIR